MHTPTFLLLTAAASFTAAQTSSSSSTPKSGCGDSIDLIIQSCLGTTGLQLSACATQDWDCLCEQGNNVLTCYNNCPSDPNRFGVEQTKIANCNAAAAYGTKSATATGSRTGTPTAGTPTGASNTGTSSSAAPSATSSAGFDSGAGRAGVPAAGLAAILGLVALF